MSYKRKFTITLIALIIPILLASFGMIIIDPYFHFHKPLNGIPYTLEEDTYINAGVLSNFDYNSVIVGSSLASLMEPSIVDNRLGLDTVLVTLRGASAKTGVYLMDYALKKNKRIKNIYYSLDYNGMTGDKDKLSRDLPDYLYDNNPLNDTQYLLNKDIWIDGVYTLFDKNRTTPIINNFDEAYGFDSYVQFSRASVVSNMPEEFFSNYISLDLEKYASSDDYISSIKNMGPEQNVIGNIICNIEPLLEGNQNIQFYFYIAPVPILHWYEVEDINQICANLYYIFSELSQYENCHLSFFYGDEVSEDVYRYCDLLHWDRKVGRYMLNSMIDGDKVITKDNINDKIYAFYERVRAYDFNNFNYIKYPFQAITDYNEFLDAVNNNKYMKIVLVNGDVSSEYIDGLKERGYVSDTCRGNNYYYSVAVNGVTYEKADDEPFEDIYDFNGRKIHVQSKGYGDEASITIGDGEYCPEADPIDIVILDLESDMVIDSVGLNIETGELNQY